MQNTDVSHLVCSAASSLQAAVELLCPIGLGTYKGTSAQPCTTRLHAAGFSVGKAQALVFFHLSQNGLQNKWKTGEAAKVILLNYTACTLPAFLVLATGEQSSFRGGEEDKAIKRIAVSLARR